MFPIPDFSGSQRASDDVRSFKRRVSINRLLILQEAETPTLSISCPDMLEIFHHA